MFQYESAVGVYKSVTIQNIHRIDKQLIAQFLKIYDKLSMMNLSSSYQQDYSVALVDLIYSIKCETFFPFIMNGKPF